MELPGTPFLKDKEVKKEKVIHVHILQAVLKSLAVVWLNVRSFRRSIHFINHITFFLFLYHSVCIQVNMGSCVHCKTAFVTTVSVTVKSFRKSYPAYWFSLIPA